MSPGYPTPWSQLRSFHPLLAADTTMPIISLTVRGSSPCNTVARKRSQTAQHGGLFAHGAEDVGDDAETEFALDLVVDGAYGGIGDRGRVNQG